MKHSLIILFLLLSFWDGQSQKKDITSEDFGNWPFVSEGVRGISGDGLYAHYKMEALPGVEKTKIILKEVFGKWQLSLPGNVSRILYSSDSKTALYLLNDTLSLVTLGTSEIKKIPYVISFSLITINGEENLVYLLNSGDKRLVIQNLITGKENKFTAVSKFQFFDQGKLLLLTAENKRNNELRQTIDIVSTTNGDRKTIYEGSEASDFIFDNDYKQLLFLSKAQNNNNEQQNDLWYYRLGDFSSNKVLGNVLQINRKRFQITSLGGFNKRGDKLFLILKEIKEKTKQDSNQAKVDVWSYTDARLQDQQLQHLQGHGFPRQLNYKAIIQVNKWNAHIIGDEDQEISFSPDKEVAFITTVGNGIHEEHNWNKASIASYELLFIRDGRKIKMPGELSGWSKDGNFIMISEKGGSRLLSYELKTGQYRNFDKWIKKQKWRYDDSPETSGMVFHRCEPILGGKFVVFQPYDIWVIDPSLNEIPKNITKGFGIRNKIRFSLVGLSDSLNGKGAIIVLKAFDEKTMNQGFFKVTLGAGTDPIKLSMDKFKYDYSYYKAFNSSWYLLMRESSRQSPNYVVTTDFKKFYPVSNLYPESEYNWYNSNLLSWKTFDGSRTQGALYKPDNFDSTKKYPVIIVYYEKRAHDLNEYLKPDGIKHEINIPYAVSQGYLVFLIDIHYKIGNPGKGIYNSIVSGAQYIGKIPWVNSKKIGINGHSWGGFETNYLITHSNIFAAALSGAGLSNMISAYGTPWPGGGHAMAEWAELRQGRFNATPWENRKVYIEHSPVLDADKVTTPLLMMHNKGDKNVAFGQATEFFIALRRLGKRVWLLQYDGDAHSVSNPANVKDFTIRTMQFFDHYLKDKPAPRWMLEGIPAELKGIETRYELDTTGKTPGSGLLIRDWNK